VEKSSLHQFPAMRREHNKTLTNDV